MRALDWFVSLPDDVRLVTRRQGTGEIRIWVVEEAVPCSGWFDGGYGEVLADIRFRQMAYPILAKSKLQRTKSRFILTRHRLRYRRTTQHHAFASPEFPPACAQVGWHTVPERVLTVRLDGTVEYETSDGEVRHVPAGGFALVEDTHGKVHLSRHSPEAQTVPMPSGLDEPQR
jgi:hypothetical protein